MTLRISDCGLRIADFGLRMAASGIGDPVRHPIRNLQSAIESAIRSPQSAI